MPRVDRHKDIQTGIQAYNRHTDNIQIDTSILFQLCFLFLFLIDTLSLLLLTTPVVIILFQVVLFNLFPTVY